ncbi:MAG TPA: MgtC/SapB family protein, partial [Proteobacteria bacterium]|nr:MgtC/SapB family protein [Pseudomonadota bacterium]
MDAVTALKTYGVALLLGALIGIEREYSKKEKTHYLAGLRSFALASTLGAVSAHLSQLISAWFLPLGFLAFASAVIVSYVITASRDVTLGMTTEISLFLSFGIGAL